MAKEKTPRCPVCRCRKSQAVPGGLFRCQNCGGIFDDAPDDGGAALSNDPVRSLELKERAAKDKRRAGLRGGL